MTPFRRGSRVPEPPVIVEGVWIVRQDESPYNTVLGVFATSAEAEEFADEVQDRFANGVLFSRFAIGYRYDRGPGYVTYGPSD